MLSMILGKYEISETFRIKLRLDILEIKRSETAGDLIRFWPCFFLRTVGQVMFGMCENFYRTGPDGLRRLLTSPSQFSVVCFQVVVRESMVITKLPQYLCVYTYQHAHTYIHACMHAYIHYITLHCITLHYIALHYIHTYHTYINMVSTKFPASFFPGSVPALQLGDGCGRIPGWRWRRCNQGYRNQVVKSNGKMVKSLFFPGKIWNKNGLFIFFMTFRSITLGLLNI